MFRTKIYDFLESAVNFKAEPSTFALASYPDVLRLVTRDEPENVCVGDYVCV